MSEPRMMRNKECQDGTLLNVNTTLLQLGLSRCRGVAESGLVGVVERGEFVNILKEIVDIVRGTLHEIEEYEVGNEVEVVLRNEVEAGENG